MDNRTDGRSVRQTLVLMVTIVIIAAVLACSLAVRAGRAIAKLQAIAPLHTPIIIAHRGSDEAPENSLEAIRAAAAHHADYAEIDVRLTSDGIPVVFHDRKTGRLSSSGRNVTVSKTKSSVLLDMRMWQRGVEFHVPTLRQALFEAEHTPNALGLLLDVKTDDRHAYKTASAISQVVERFRFKNRLMVMSTSRAAVRVFERLHPEWRIGLCVSGRPQHAEWGSKRVLRMDFIVLRGHEITHDFLKAAGQRKVPVYAGSVNDYREARRLLRLGVSGFLGDDIGRLRDAIAADDEDGAILRG